MSWSDTDDVTVSSYQVINRKIFFVITLTTSEKRVRVSVPTVSSSDTVFLTTLRSYSQFRHLWKRLRECVNEPPGATHRPRQLKVKHVAQTCHCAKDHCVFDALHPMLQSFPSRRLIRSKFVGLDHDAINMRRNALAGFIAHLQEFFCTFASGTLHEKMQDGNCLVLKTYVNFLGASEHFLTDELTVLRRPLALSGWRQQCVEQIVGQDEEKDDGAIMDTVPERNEMHVVTSCAVAPRIVEDLAFFPFEEDEKEFERLPLPVLQVKVVPVHTMHTFMEEFCEHVLSEFASDIDELNSSELTQARRWEICLYMACRIGHTYAVQLILYNYADANTALADGSSCLHAAARIGRSEIVALLIEQGANVNKANDAGVTPLIAACRDGCVDVVKLLLDAGAEVSICSERGTYPLHAAIVSQNVEIVSMLVEWGADVNVMTASGITPLHFAAKLGLLAISEYLLRHDADPDKRTKNDSDAMMIAEANGHATICELFQRFSSSVPSEQARSDYMLNISESDKFSSMVRLLLQRHLPRAVV